MVLLTLMFLDIDFLKLENREIPYAISGYSVTCVIRTHLPRISVHMDQNFPTYLMYINLSGAKPLFSK